MVGGFKGDSVTFFINPDSNDCLFIRIIFAPAVDRPLGRTTNKNQRRSSPFFSALAKEDVEYDDIELADVPSYVNISFENHVTLALSGEGNTEKHFERSNPETDRKGVRIVWVEHAKTGELVPVAVRDGGAFAEDSSQVPEEVSDNGDDANSPLLMPPSLSGKQLIGDSHNCASY